MPLVTIDLPPGVHRVGTEFQSAGRWWRSNLVRWRDGAMQPVGGWQSRLSVVSGTPRGSISWSDNSGDRRFAVGTADKLIAVLESGLIQDITPTGLTVGLVDADRNTGYGGGFYGLGLYGTERDDAGGFSEATTWSLDTWGENLIACSSADGEIYEWDLDPMADAAALSNAPANNLAVMVTEERFVFALGAGGNRRKVQWSDKEDNNTWTPTATNEAGDIDLQTQGQIMCGIRTRGQALILTDQDAHTATYQGPPFVYGFQRVGTGCGIVSRRAAASVDAGVFWLGQRGFYVYAGGAVQEIPCEVTCCVFQDMNTAQQSKVHAVANSQFSEIWWFFPSSASNEVDRYVIYNYRENHWSLGRLQRTTGFDNGVFGNPIWFDADGEAYNHEFGLSHDGNEVFAETGPISLGAGDNVFTALNLYPDEANQGDVQARFKTKFYPNDAAYNYGPYAMTNPTSVRFTGRQVSMRVEAVRNASFRVGAMRLDVMPGGKR